MHDETRLAALEEVGQFFDFSLVVATYNSSVRWQMLKRYSQLNRLQE